MDLAKDTHSYAIKTHLKDKSSYQGGRAAFGLRKASGLHKKLRLLAAANFVAQTITLYG